MIILEALSHTWSGGQSRLSHLRCMWAAFACLAHPHQAQPHPLPLPRRHPCMGHLTQAWERCCHGGLVEVPQKAAWDTPHSVVSLAIVGTVLRSAACTLAALRSCQPTTELLPCPASLPKYFQKLAKMLSSQIRLRQRILRSAHLREIYSSDCARSSGTAWSIPQLHTSRLVAAQQNTRTWLPRLPSRCWSICGPSWFAPSFVAEMGCNQEYC